VPGERKTIVLVDDSPIILKLARNTLMSRYDVFTMPSVEKMFQFLERTLPDLILLDILMPETSGYEAITILKKDRRTADIPVIFLTSRSDADSELEGLSLGAVDYIAKPFSAQLLSKRVEIHMLLETQKKELQNLNGNLMEMVKQKTDSVLDLQKALLTTMSNLVECRDDITGSHVERTEHFLACFLDEMMRGPVYGDIIKTWDIDLFLQSAQLHDVGKIAIRDSVLMKPGKLTSEEFEEMKKHTTFGEAVIEKIQQSAKESMFLTHARIMAGTHHEKWDGTGYPRGISGSGIPLQGRLMAIADVYDALVSTRPYKEAFTHEQAIHIIENESGSHFDPTLVDIFLSSHELFQ
jgi:putative two-component system response regulator